MNADVVVIGGGPAGLMAAGTAARTQKKVTLIEKNNILGKKLLITGKGRCNVTNACDISEFFDNIVKNKNFLYSALYSFTNEDLIKFFNDCGVSLKVERGNRVFPKSDKSADILKALKKYVNNVNIVYGNEVKELIIKDNVLSGVKLADGNIIKCKSAIIATGGVSYPATGSTGDGYILAKGAGHTVTDLKPALVPLVICEEFSKKLAGLSLKNIAINLKDSNGKTVYEDFGELLFTHKGLSGPVILSASNHIDDKKRYTVSIDLKPALSYEKLEKRVLSDFSKNSNKDFKNSLNDLLPKKLIPVIIELSKINPDKKINVITKEERKILVNLLKDFCVNIKCKEIIDEAIITDGGINLKEINPQTMESKIVKGLFFAGEILDVHAYTGGFNLQIAFSTGFLAGNNV